MSSLRKAKHRLSAAIRLRSGSGCQFDRISRRLYKGFALALEGGIVGVAFGAGGVEGGGVGTVEGAAFGEARRQVGICDEEFAEGDGVGFAFVEKLLAGVLVDGFVGDEDSAEDFLEAWADAVEAGVFA